MTCRSDDTQRRLSGGELRWRCRRGMLELDLLLQAFVEQSLEGLTHSEKIIFDRLLDYPDQVLLELLMKQAPSVDMEINHIVEKIRLAVHTTTAAEA